MNKVKQYYLIIFVILFHISAYAKIGVAVVPFKNNDEIAGMLTDKLDEISKTENNNKLEVLSQYKVKVKRDLVKIKDEELTDPLKILDLGKILHVNFIVFGNYSELDNTAKISVQVIDINSGTIRNIYQLTGFKNEIKTLVSRLANILFYPENYTRPKQDYKKIKIRLPKTNIPAKNSYFDSDLSFENAKISDITIKNFSSFKSNFTPFFYLENNIEIIGTLEEKNGENIAIIDSNTGSTKIMLGTFSPYKIRTIALSPDRKKIVYESNNDIYVLNFDGSNRKKVDFGINPSWSPDNKKIAYLKGGSSKLFCVTADDEIDEPIELVNGKTTAWFPAGKEIIYNYNFDSSVPFLSLISTSDKIKHDLEGEEALSYYFIFASNSYGGQRIPMFIKRNWLVRKNLKNQIELVDIINNEIEIIKIKGKPVEANAEKFCWSKDGRKLTYLDNKEKDTIIVADFDFKEKIYFKLNIGARDGIQEGDELDLIELEERKAPKTEEIYRFQEKNIGKAIISKVFPNICVAYTYSYEIDMKSKKLIKYTLTNGAEIEGNILYYGDDVLSFLEKSKDNASKLFKSANDLFDAGNFNEAKNVLKKIVDIYPETQYYKNAKDMQKILPNKRIADE